ncbi:MAG: hypothetical protein NTV02_01130 [Candidatus Zambryskibacteria bacterium]|nr:hypothetical protein [Candidatus Zambryskibacteria bacterium]
MDNQGHKKDIVPTDSSQNQAAHSSNNNSPIDYFSQDQSFVFVYKKTEKLATALYMVTNLFGDAEPMKWTLRIKVSHLLSFIIGFKEILESREHEFSNEVKTKVLEIVSLLEVASRSGLVSPMNFSILKTEFMNLVEALSSFKKEITTGTRFSLPQTFFDVALNKEVEKDTSGGMQTFNTPSPRSFDKRQSNAVKDNLSFTDTPENKDSFKKTNRQSIIINLLKKKKDLTIKDIAQVIRDCSEKTIQRELIALIQIGVLKKVGERRWSKYSLVE